MNTAFCLKLAMRLKARRYPARDAARLFWICYLSVLAVYSTRCRSRGTAMDPESGDNDSGSAGRVSFTMEDICDFLPGETDEVPRRYACTVPAAFPVRDAATALRDRGQGGGPAAGNIPAGAASGE